MERHLIDSIALTMHKGVTAPAIIFLCELFGSASEVFAASEAELIDRASLKPDTARAISGRIHHRAAEDEVAYLQNRGYWAISAEDGRYPPLLRETPDYPYALYIKGNPDIFSLPMLSIVGTREVTSYGLSMCERLVEGLAHSMPDLVIVSGLAYGVDVAAHRAALRCGLRTVAVMGTPLDTIYPPHHTAIAREIVEKGGALVTEYHSKIGKTQTYFFIQRNRIIAGLSSGTVVVESAAKGGSLITADLAQGYFRSVMAVPGRATEKSSTGTNRLIKSAKAQMVCTAEDILEELGWESACREAKSAERESLNELQRKILSELTRNPQPEYQLAEVCGVAIGEIYEALFILECSGYVRFNAGKYEKR